MAQLSTPETNEHYHAAAVKIAQQLHRARTGTRQRSEARARTIQQRFPPWNRPGLEVAVQHDAASDCYPHRRVLRSHGQRR